MPPVLAGQVNVNIQAVNQGVQKVKEVTDDAAADAARAAKEHTAKINRIATTAIIGVGAITMELFKATMASMAFESSFAGIRKTVEATEEQFDNLAQKIKDMSSVTPVSTDDLNRIGELGGQLGVAVENLPDFIKTVGELATTTNLTVENAALGLARLDAIAQTNGETFSNVASTIVDLGNNFAATEGEIMTTVLRIAQAAAQVGATTQDALAFAAALQAIGVPAQAGGTAVARVFQSINQAIIQGGENLDLFAKVAATTGDTTEESFAAFFEDDPARATQAFIEGLNNLNESGADVIGILDELGLSQRRTMLAILGLAEAEGVLADAITTANKAFDENMAATEEAIKRFETLESQLQVTKNLFNELQIQIGDNLLPVATSFNNTIQKMILGLTESNFAFNSLMALLIGFGATLMKVASQLKFVQVAFKFLVGSKIRIAVTAITGLFSLFGLKVAESAGEVGKLARELDYFSNAGKITESTLKAVIRANTDFKALMEDLTDTQKNAIEADVLDMFFGEHENFNEAKKQIDDQIANIEALRQASSGFSSMGSAKIIDLKVDQDSTDALQQMIEAIVDVHGVRLTEEEALPFLQALKKGQLNKFRKEYDAILAGQEQQYKIQHDLFIKLLPAIQEQERQRMADLKEQAMERLGITKVEHDFQRIQISNMMKLIENEQNLQDSMSDTNFEVEQRENIFDRIASNTLESAESLFTSLDSIGGLAMKTGEEINQALAEKIQLSQIFEQQIAYLKNEGFDDVALEFSKLGPQFSGVLQELLDNTDQLNLREVMLEKLGLSESEELKDALFESTDSAADAIVPKTTQLGNDYIKGFIKGLKEQEPELAKTIETVFSNAVQLAYDVTGTKSPSRVTMELGKFMMLGFVKGIEDNYPTLEKSWKGKTIDLVNLIEQSVRDATSAMKSAFGSQFGLFNAQQSYLDNEDKINDLIKERTQLLKGNTAEQTKNLDEARDKAEWAKIAYEEGVITLAEYQLAQQELEDAENARANRLAEVNKEIKNEQMSQAQNLFSLGMDAFELLQMGPEAFDMFKELAEVLGIDASIVEKVTGKTKELADTLGKKFGDSVDGIAKKFFDTNLKIEQEEIEINVNGDEAMTTVNAVQGAWDNFRASAQDEVKLKIGADGSFDLGGQTGYAKGGRIPMYAKGGYLGSGLGIVGEAGPELIRAIPGGGVDITPIGNVGHTGITVNNLNVNVTGVPSNPIQARKAAIEIRKALSKLDREGVVGTGLRGR